jgi:hypothetical protein
MNPASNFCTNCGQPLGAKTRFCGGCGTEVPPAGTQEIAPPAAYQTPPVDTHPPVSQSFQETPPPVYQQSYYPPQQAYYAPQPAAPVYGYQSPATGIPGELIIGVIPNASKRKNLVLSDTFNIIVTSHRMICALVTSKMIKDEAASHRGEGIGGFFKAMGSGYTLWQRYLQMPPELALQENPENFAIYMNQIHRVKYKPDKVLFNKGAFSVGLKMGVGVDDDDDKNTRPLEIETVAGKYKFEINDMNQQQTAEILKKAGLIR